MLLMLVSCNFICIRLLKLFHHNAKILVETPSSTLLETELFVRLLDYCGQLKGDGLCSLFFSPAALQPLLLPKQESASSPQEF